MPLKNRDSEDTPKKDDRFEDIDFKALEEELRRIKMYHEQKRREDAQALVEMMRKRITI